MSTAVEMSTEEIKALMASPMKMYLGDSVYVDIENGMYKLTTENGISISNTIYLEPEVMHNLFRYVRRVKKTEAKGVDG